MRRYKDCANAPQYYVILILAILFSSGMIRLYFLELLLLTRHCACINENGA